MESITLSSYAKLNLGLNVLGKRRDGYHDIETVLQAVSLSDSVKVELGPEDLEVQCDRPEVPKRERNLAYRAAQEFVRRAKLNVGARITIEKRIPLGGGLGGASSNAAAVLIALNLLTGRRLAKEELASAGAELGSDVPFFLCGGTALARGRGELLDCSLPTPPLCFVIVYPNFPISTRWAYSRIDESTARREASLGDQSERIGARFSLTGYTFSANMMAEAIRAGALSQIAANLGNSFEEVVFQTYPELSKIKEELISSGVLGASLSGSGSSLFGICEGENGAQRISHSLGQSGHWVKAVKALSREESFESGDLA